MDPTDLKHRYRRIEHAVEGATGPGSSRRFAERLLPRLLEQLGEADGVSAVELYERRDGSLHRSKREGRQLPPLDAELRAKLGSDALDLPWAGEAAEAGAAILPVTATSDLVIALRFSDGERPQDDPLALAAPLHYAIQHALRRRELEDEAEQARAIQTSLLPAIPAFSDLDIAAFSRPARRVGGDLYDFLLLDAETLGIAVADASGHGLPAALQARDVITGLRMGAERDLRLTRTVEKLNRVIHRSGLTTRFVSLVFAEIERNGNLLYVNAGHPPPFLLDDSGIRELNVGGVLLGPYPEATYTMGVAHLDPGAALLFYTDGVVERRDGDGEMFGSARLAAWLGDHRETSAAEALGDLLQTLDRFAREAPLEDDVTAVFVRRPR